MKSLFKRTTPTEGATADQAPTPGVLTNRGENADTQMETDPQSKIATGGSNNTTSTDTHGRELTSQEGHQTSRLKTRPITLDNVLVCLYYALTRVKEYGGILVMALMLTSNCAQARPTPNLGPSRTGEEFGLNHRFTAYDCDHPTAVQALRLPEHCLTQKNGQERR